MRLQLSYCEANDLPTQSAAPELPAEIACLTPMKGEVPVRRDRSVLQAVVEADNDIRVGLLKLLPLARFAKHCILPPGFTYPAELADSVAVTDRGTQCLEYLQSTFPDLPGGDAHAVVLAHTAHDELLIDIRNCDLETIESALSQEIRNISMRFPFIYYRELYERYFEAFGTYSVPISAEETQVLLSGTSQGVFQVARLCAGPFGLLEAGQMRYLPPVNSAPLAHCRDPGCPGIHAVTCVTSTTPAGDAYQALGKHLMTTFGAPSPWGDVFIDLLVPDETHYADVKSADLPQLLGNALGDSELRRLLVELMQGDGSRIRPALAPVLPRVQKSSNSQIADALDRAQLMQALLLVTDEEISTMLDRLVGRGDIRIPATEVRASAYSSSGGTTQRAQLSRLGVRFDAPGLGTSRLKALILKTHTPEDLGWQLLDTGGDSIPEKVDTLVRSSDVSDTVDRYLLNTREQFRSTAEYLKFGDFPEPSTAAERSVVLSKVLWKLGFDIEDYPDLPGVFRRRMAALDAEIRSPIDSEDRIEAIRSVGVNVFVSLEEVLDEALAFSCFALLTDHYGQPRWQRFSYQVRSAREAMVEALDGGERSAGEALQLTANGKNNLFGLVHGFRELAEIIDELVSRAGAAATYKRDRESFPLWARHGGLYRFPFVHTVPVLDLMPERVAGLTERLRQVTKVLLGADVMGVRNRVPHGGGEFPSLQSLQLASVAMDEVLRLLEESGFSPSVYYPNETYVDRMGRSRRVLRDYLGREFALYRPSELAKCHLPQANEPQVVCRLATIRDTSEVLRFRVRVESDFSAMWAGYPRIEVAEDGAQAGAQDKEEQELLSGQTT